MLAGAQQSLIMYLTQSTRFAQSDSRLVRSRHNLDEFSLGLDQITVVFQLALF
jgi:hypothetical protein